MLFRDVIQFATMLVLVQLLSPAEYGSMALAQAIFGLLSVLSFSTFILHALQVRDPANIDWHTHFTAAMAMNSTLCLVTIAVAALIYQIERFSAAALPLVALSVVFILEVPASLSLSMIQVEHNWKRFRILLMVGAIVSSCIGILMALWGGGVWALIAQSLFAGCPAIFHLFLVRKWKPNWSWSRSRYLETARFGFTRIGSAGLNGFRNLIEQGSVAAAYDLTALGNFTRSFGLANLVAGRVGPLAMSSLYPIITRAEPSSEKFKSYSGLILRGAAWATLPAAALLAIAAGDVVDVIYGAQWQAVTKLLPLASLSVALVGVTATAYYLILANNGVKRCLRIDIVSGGLGVAIALLVVPMGIDSYLLALAMHGALILTVTLYHLCSSESVKRADIFLALAPAVASVVAAVLAVIAVRNLWQSQFAIMRIMLDGFVFVSACLVVLRLVFSRALRELIAIAPGGRRLMPLLYRMDDATREFCC